MGAFVRVRSLDLIICYLLRGWGVDKTVKRWYNYPRFKPDEKCRFCPHNAVFHLEIKNFGMASQMGRWTYCKCNCPGYAPVDNLGFLEVKADERE
jgi:hypothetical protein